VKRGLTAEVCASRSESCVRLDLAVVTTLTVSVLHVVRTKLVLVSISCQAEEMNSKLWYDVANKCSDGLKSPGETGIDCGGVCFSIGKLCAVGSGCTNDTDCSSTTCGVNDTCVGEYSVFARNSRFTDCCVI
jgi:hypothetical protein